ncbi:hypothetical protein HELRODRAFT_170823 [Helobdella robusta]|uniref:UPAR/Ly6 domain-containing protein n=1 Tax=Helobdella robusta TaxID=6412 RepID=T1F3H0_HELRO|nr:hypothetical protein HELRODRAFT_170823 [Helobdella robusta]ESO06801.1 hypothetical protein HELRODRAFT_170823 [Helobdella robusta]
MASSLKFSCMSAAVVFLLVTSFFVDMVQSVNCYKCDTDSSVCFNFCTGDYCVKTQYMEAGKSVVSKYCGSGSDSMGCVGSQILGFGGYICNCNSFLCNDSKRSSVSAMLAVLVLILALVINMVL